ncbi:hypothetical protein EIP86_000498 [Pleurotus ostreatoroseus]|nr:hypothetical protein EIP86_000498 [Pleurotus ostreatoroseus]
MEALDVALNFHQQTDNRAPAFHRSSCNESQDTVVMPRRSDGRARESPPPLTRKELALRNILDDTDVVEVVKVKRKESFIHEEGDMGESRMKKSKSFRARASKAFKSIRNLNAAKNHRKQDAENAAPVSENGTYSSRPPTPSLPRRKSMQLSQFFSSTRTSRSASFDVPPMPPSPTSPTSPTSRTSASSDWSRVSRPLLTLSECANLQATQNSQSQSTLSSKRSFRRRISVLDLQRLFTPSSQSNERAVPSHDQCEDILPPQRSSASEYQPVTPSVTSGSGFLQSLDSAFTGSSSTIRSPSTPYPSTFEDMGIHQDEDFAMGDESFEMRLDSLHFDSLQFDPEEF